MNDEQVAELASTVIDQIADIVVVLDQAGTIRYANARAEHMLGMQRSEWIGRPVFDIVHPDDLSLALELLVSTQAAGSGVREPVSYRIRTSEDRWVTIEVLGSNIELDGGEIALALSGREISIRRPGLEIVNEVSERLARMFDDAAIGMMQMTLDGRLLRVNPAFAEMLGLTAGDLVGRFDAEFTQPEDREIDRQRLSQLAGGELATYRRSKRYVAVDDRAIHVELTASLVRDRHGHPLYCAAQTVDVTALRAAEAELVYRSTHDPLTDLANRVLLHTLLDQALSRAARRGDAIGILFLDLDGFKLVNDTHGHAAGDALLVQVAQRLRGTVRNGDVVSRFGGDEFVVMCEDTDERTLEEIAGRIIEALAAPFTLDNAVARIGVSVGIAIEPAADVSADDLLRYADTALYQAKGTGRGQITRHSRSTNRGT